VVSFSNLQFLSFVEALLNPESLVSTMQLLGAVVGVELNH
jgi:hypothetical protein